MHYPPPHHQDDDKHHMIEVIKTYPLATLISVNNNESFISHLPLIYRDLKLIGHIDIYNPQAELLKGHREVTVLFHGPQCYISPSIYSTTQLPTWNYVKVHLKGKVREITDANTVKNDIIKMTEFLEGKEQRYILHPDNPRMEKFVNYIAGFEIDITHWEGKFKLSQDKKPGDIKAARQELIRANTESIEQFLDNVF